VDRHLHEGLTATLLPPTPTTVRFPATVVGPEQEQAARRLPWLLAGLVLTWLGCEAVTLAGLTTFGPTYLGAVSLLNNPHFPIALAGMFVFYLCLQPSGRDLTILGLIALALAAGIKLLDLVGGWRTPLPYCVCNGLGLASLGMMTAHAWSSTGAVRKRALDVLLTAVLVIGSIPLIFFFLEMTIHLHRTTLDALAYAADSTLGTQVTFVLGRWFTAVPGLAMVPGVVYVTLPLAFMVIVVLHLRRSGPPVQEVLPTFLAVAISGFFVYNFFPLVGPMYAFADVYPHSPPDVSAVLAGSLTVPDMPRNCMPSLHTAWALVIWWQARPLGRAVRLMAGIYLGFTILATIGYGAHYVFDLVVAFPSTMACQALCLLVPASAARLRWRTLLCGVVLTLLWLGLLRWGLAVLALSPFLTASAALATVVGCLALEHRLYRAAEKSRETGKIFLRPI
jgi:hypothetical protein